MLSAHNFHMYSISNMNITYQEIYCILFLNYTCMCSKNADYRKRKYLRGVHSHLN